MITWFITHLLGWNTDGCPNLDNPGLHHDPGDDGIPSIENKLGHDLELAREDGNVFMLLSQLLLHLFPVGHELIKEMVDDVCLEDFDALPVSHVLGIPFHFHIKC